MRRLNSIPSFAVTAHLNRLLSVLLATTNKGIDGSIVDTESCSERRHLSSLSMNATIPARRGWGADARWVSRCGMVLHSSVYSSSAQVKLSRLITSYTRTQASLYRKAVSRWLRFLSGASGQAAHRDNSRVTA